MAFIVPISVNDTDTELTLLATVVGLDNKIVGTVTQDLVFECTFAMLVDRES